MDIDNEGEKERNRKCKGEKVQKEERESVDHKQ